MKKVALFVFNGDPMCFIHVLLNAIDMADKGYDVKTVIEGSATKLLPELAKEGNPLHALWEKAKEKKLIQGVCKACANKMGTLASATEQGLSLLGDMSGHPAISGFRDEGWEIITF
ncbi:MAG: DsrE family protein [Proteobacteria bacterium]|nr:DsrE family protein [Pseudomonadota bacterium]